MTEIEDKVSARRAIAEAAEDIAARLRVLEDARRLAPSRELSIAITEIETGLLWLDKANR
jgi:hypothetical protein